MRRNLALGLVFILVMSSRLGCLGWGQPNLGAAPNSAAVLTGFRAAAISYSPIFELGSNGRLLRVLGGEYWTDSVGNLIPWGARIPRKPGDTHHQLTRIIVGSNSYSIPLAPAVVGSLGSLCAMVFLLAGFGGLAFALRHGKSEQGNPKET